MLGIWEDHLSHIKLGSEIGLGPGALGEKCFSQDHNCKEFRRFSSSLGHIIFLLHVTSRRFSRKTKTKATNTKGQKFIVKFVQSRASSLAIFHLAEAYELLCCSKPLKTHFVWLRSVEISQTVVLLYEILSAIIVNITQLSF